MQDLQILPSHRVPAAVLDVLHRAQRFAVLSSPWLRAWPHFAAAVHGALARGVRLHFAVRTADGTCRERQRQADEVAALRRDGAVVHEVPKLHAKLYANEDEAVLASMNLTGCSLQSLDLGVRVRNRDVVHRLLSVLAEHVPPLQPLVGPPAASVLPTPRACCIGCAMPLPRDDRHPMCRPCYAASRGGFVVHDLPARCCHQCGAPALTTVRKPLCEDCAPAASATPPSRLQALLRPRARPEWN